MVYLYLYDWKIELDISTPTLTPLFTPINGLVLYLDIYPWLHFYSFETTITFERP